MANECKSLPGERLMHHSCQKLRKLPDVSNGNNSASQVNIGPEATSKGTPDVVSSPQEFVECSGMDEKQRCLQDASPSATGESRTLSTPPWTRIPKPLSCGTLVQIPPGLQLQIQGCNGRLPSNSSSSSCASCCNKQSFKVHLSSGILNSKAEVELHGTDATTMMARLMDRLTLQLGRNQTTLSSGNEDDALVSCDSGGTFKTQGALSHPGKTNYPFELVNLRRQHRQSSQAPPRALFNVSQRTADHKHSLPHSPVAPTDISNKCRLAEVERRCSSSSSTAMSCGTEPLAAPAYFAPVFKRRNNTPSRPTPPINHLSPVSIMKQKPRSFGEQRETPVEHLGQAASTIPTQPWASNIEGKVFSTQPRSVWSAQHPFGQNEYKPIFQTSPSSEASTRTGGTERSFGYQLLAASHISPRHDINEPQNLRGEKGLVQLEQCKKAAIYNSNPNLKKNKADEADVLPTSSKAHSWDVVTQNLIQEKKILQENRKVSGPCQQDHTGWTSDFSSAQKLLYGRSGSMFSDGNEGTTPHVSLSEQTTTTIAPTSQSDLASAAPSTRGDIRACENGKPSKEAIDTGAPRVPQLYKAVPTQVYSDVAFVIPKMRDKLVPVVTDTEVQVKVVDAARAANVPGCPSAAVTEASYVLPVTLARYKPYLVPVDVYIPKLVHVPLNLLKEETTTTPVMPIPMDNGNVRMPSQSLKRNESTTQASEPSHQQRLQQQLHKRLNPHLLDLKKYNAQQQKHFRDLLHQAEQQAAACGVPVPTPTSTPVLNVDRIRPADAAKTDPSNCPRIALDVSLRKYRTLFLADMPRSTLSWWNIVCS